MATRTISFNVMLAPIEKHNLAALAEFEGRTMGAIIREMIGRRHDMRFQNRPCCVSGDRCYVPHMHKDNQTPHAGEIPPLSPGSPK